MPKPLPALWIDAFTAAPLTGNACLVILDADDLDEPTMQAVAREANLSETAFVMRSDVARFRARYFTPGEEIPLAGHPTMAVSCALVDTQRLGADESSFSLQLQAGVIQVEIDQTRYGPRFIMSQRPPVFMRTYDAEQVMPIFGLTAADALPSVPLQTVSTGTPQLMIPVRDLAVLERLAMDHAGYKRLRAQGDFFSPHLFCTQGISEDARTFARHLSTSPDTAEDPFTGSATGGMAAYLWRYGLIDAPTFIAEQGHWMGRPGRAYVEVVGGREAIETVKVGGHAVTLIRGEIYL